MKDGVLYPIIVALILFPGWLAYTHPAVFKRLCRKVSEPVAVLWVALIFVVWGYVEGLKEAKSMVNDALLVQRFETRIAGTEDRLQLMVIGFLALGAFLTFLYVSATTWKNSRDEEPENKARGPNPEKGE